MTLCIVGAAGFVSLLGWSGYSAFQRHAHPVPLAATDRPSDRPAADARAMGQRPAPRVTPDTTPTRYEEIDAPQPPASTPRTTALTSPTNSNTGDIKHDRQGNIIMVDGRPWTGEVFDFRPIAPVRAQTMRTTAYSPDERSCGKWADGITASGKSVWMNGGRLVAADPAIPYGTILTIPGYNNNQPVQVWDRGGKIKGNRLDLLYPTHEIALQWGVQDKRVVFWGFVETD